MTKQATRKKIRRKSNNKTKQGPNQVKGRGHHLKALKCLVQDTKRNLFCLTCSPAAILNPPVAGGGQRRPVEVVFLRVKRGLWTWKRGISNIRIPD